MNLRDALSATAPGGWTNDEGFAASSRAYTEERLSRGVWVSDNAWMDEEGGIHRRYVSPRRSRGGQYLRRVRRLAAKKLHESHADAASTTEANEGDDFPVDGPHGPDCYDDEIVTDRLTLCVECGDPWPCSEHRRNRIGLLR